MVLGPHVFLATYPPLDLHRFETNTRISWQFLAPLDFRRFFNVALVDFSMCLVVFHWLFHGALVHVLRVFLLEKFIFVCLCLLLLCLPVETIFYLIERRL